MLEMFLALAVQPIGVVLEQYLAEAIDVLQWRTQVVGDRIAEGFQFFVGGFQFGGALFELLIQTRNLLFGLLTLADVTNGAGNQNPDWKNTRLNSSHLG